MIRKLHKNHQAFTRVELLIALATTGLLGSLAVSVLASSATRSDLAVCANNLRQVGRAFHMWASDHGGENPWWTHYNSGGSYIPFGGPAPPGNVINLPGMGPVPASLRNNAWLQFGFISEELRTPAVLVCPSDRTRFRALEFSYNHQQGFFFLNFQNRATSYLIGVHALSHAPASLLSGDRSLKEDGVNSNCSINFGLLSWIEIDGSPPGWTSDLHPNAGNLLFNDGSVQELSAVGLKQFFPQTDDAGSTHLIEPN